MPARRVIRVGVYDSSASKSRKMRIETIDTSREKWIFR